MVNVVASSAGAAIDQLLSKARDRENAKPRHCNVEEFPSFRFSNELSFSRGNSNPRLRPAGTLTGMCNSFPNNPALSPTTCCAKVSVSQRFSRSSIVASENAATDVTT
jgi:hypothetical protein